MVVGVSCIEIFFPESHSLKDKRQMIKKVVEKTRARFNISIIEVRQTNLWQRASIGFALMGINRDHVNSAIENVHRHIESLYLGEVINTWTEIIVMGNEV
ncbi:MAG: hypothetical protein A4E64_02568 [Syntrophorhabdus sp. PtaU1.Bin058]|nr:MAG: hypothetical protein A4E64_02568 [Syntrophorhabdus sp. PtaU1.Bin058]